MKERNASEAIRHLRMVKDIIQYEQGAVANAELTRTEVGDEEAFQRILADFSGDPRFQSLSQVPQRHSSWATWAATHSLPPRGPYIARVIYDYDPCLSTRAPSPLESSTIWLAAAGALGLAAILFMSRKP